MTYRPDIDGLRAVAVIAVILFHLNAAWLPGGFLGVDIFFVISGYLIGGILYRELTTHTFSLKRFYLRRMRRILPAFFAVVIFTLVVTTFIIVPESNEDVLTRRTALTSLFFSGNFISSMGGGYFSPNAELLPLNHLWSLAVEEQFYLVYPLLLWGLLVISMRLCKHRVKSVLIGGLCVLALISFALAFIDVWFLGSVLTPYYLPHLRFGELLVGAVLAILMSHSSQNDAIQRKNILSKRNVVVGEIFCLLILLACLLLPFPNQVPLFPGFVALVPCLSVAGLIALGTHHDSWVRKVLSAKSVVYVGKISYSLYLWHWPVLAFVRYVYQKPLPIGILLMCTAVIVFLSLLSYYVIEQPLRYKKWDFGKTGLFYYVLPACIAYLLYSFSPYKSEMDVYSTCGIPGYSNSQYANLRVGSSETKPNVIIRGDSYAIHLLAFWERMAKHEGWAAHFSGAHGTPFFLTEKNNADFPHLIASKVDHQSKDTAIREDKTVIISNNWATSGEKYVEQQKKLGFTLQELTSRGYKVILIFSAPKLEYSLLSETFAHVQGWKSPSSISLSELHGVKYREDVAGRKRMIAEIHRSFPSVRCIEFLQFFPYSAMANGKTLMRDTYHISYYGANYLADRFIADGRRLIVPTKEADSSTNTSNLPQWPRLHPQNEITKVAHAATLQ